MMTKTLRSGSARTRISLSVLLPTIHLPTLHIPPSHTLRAITPECLWEECQCFPWEWGTLLIHRTCILRAMLCPVPRAPTPHLLTALLSRRLTDTTSPYLLALSTTSHHLRVSLRWGYLHLIPHRPAPYLLLLSTFVPPLPLVLGLSLIHI